jgi:hypothetical protein
MHRHKCVFIHIPKNAGSAVLKLLGHEGGRDHVEWRHYNGCNPGWFAQYYKFAICRHPLDRLLSGYLYVLNGGNQSEQDIALRERICSQSSNFNSFVTNVLDNDFINENILFKPQYLFVYNPAGVCQVDSLLRFEQLEEDWQKLAKLNGYPLNLPKVNLNSTIENRHLNATYSLPTEALNKVMSLYHKDFALFNYSAEYHQ